MPKPATVTKWLFEAIRFNEDGSVADKCLEIFETTITELEVLTTVAPAIRDEVFITQRDFPKECVKFYRIFEMPMGVTEE